MKNILLFFFLINTSTFFLSAQENLTLEQAISIGLENNFGLKIADKNIQIAENNNTWARAGKGPTLDLNGSFSNTAVNDNNPASFLQGTYYNGSLGATLDANWVLYSGGRIQVVKEQLNLSVSQQQLLRSQEVHDLLRAITQSYTEVLFQIERRGFLYEVFDLSKGRLDFELVKRDFGQSNTYNILQFEDAVTGDSINLANQDNQIEIAKRNLYQTLNLSGFPSYTFTESLQLTQEELDLEKLQTLLAEENYTLKTLGVLAQLDQLNTALEQSGRRPTVSFNGSIGTSGSAFKFFADNPNTGDPFKTQLSNRFNGGLNLNFNWNLYDGNLTKQNIAAAKLQEEISQLSQLEAKAELYNQLEILLENYNHQVYILTLTEVQIKNARKNIEISEERFKSGQISSLDYRAAQNQFLNVADNRVNAIYSLLISKSEIDWLVGTFD